MTAAPRTVGERWAREELARLRGRHFTPTAVGAFLIASHRRSRQIRAERPDLARRATHWEAAGAAATVAAAVAQRPGSRADVVRAVGWWSGVALMLEWHLGMVESEDGEPRNLGPADALTLARAWSVPFVAVHAHPAVIATAAVTDALDGVVARATVPTRAGRDLEGLADAAVALAALHRLGRDDRIPAAAARLEVLRLTVGLGYAIAVYFARVRPPRPDLVRAGRVTAPLRVGGLVAAAAGHRRTGAALLVTGSLASLTQLARTLGDAESSGGRAGPRCMRPPRPVDRPHSAPHPHPAPAPVV